MGAAEIVTWGLEPQRDLKGDAGLSGAVPKAACIFPRMRSGSGPHTQLLP